jgi:molybdate transport system permease protein
VGFYALFWVLPLGTWLGWVLARKHFFGKTLLETLVYAPLVMPPVVTGYLLLQLFGRMGIAQWLGPTWQLSFQFSGAVLAAGVMALPLMVRSARVAFELVDPRLEVAAATLGSAPIGTFMRIVLPLAAPGLIAGSVLAFARALGEFGATITFAGSLAGETRTLPLAIHHYLQFPEGDPDAWRLSMLALLIAFVALILSEMLLRHMRNGQKARP